MRSEEGSSRSSAAGGRPMIRSQPPSFQDTSASAKVRWIGTSRGRSVLTAFSSLFFRLKDDATSNLSSGFGVASYALHRHAATSNPHPAEKEHTPNTAEVVRLIAAGV